jgi:hypothetical protein
MRAMSIVVSVGCSAVFRPGVGCSVGEQARCDGGRIVEGEAQSVFDLNIGISFQV